MAIARTPYRAVIPMTTPQNRMKNTFQPKVSRPSAMAKRLPMYSPVMAYQKTCVPPRMISAHLAPALPKVYLDWRTDVSPVRAPMQQRDATYKPRIMLPAVMIKISSSNLNAAPRDAPEAIVGVKNVKPTSTQLMESRLFLADFGTCSRG